jgi:hypothetical protein
MYLQSRLVDLSASPIRDGTNFPKAGDTVRVHYTGQVYLFKIALFYVLISSSFQMEQSLIQVETAAARSSFESVPVMSFEAGMKVFKRFATLIH